MRLLQDPITSSSTTWLSSSIATEDAGHRLAIEDAMTSGENNLALDAHLSLDASDAAPPDATRVATRFGFEQSRTSGEGASGTET